uniref:Putative plant transposon protein domain-containing protein n=1 Tax=Solanum tuberosum TaxID=4113 RepID=M1DXH1_SOLTU
MSGAPHLAQKFRGRSGARHCHGAPPSRLTLVDYRTARRVAPVEMAPKAKSVAGSKRSRKGETSGSGNREPAQKFGKKVVQRLKEKPPYRDIRHILCGVESTARWGRSKDTRRHSTLHFANFNLISRVWLKLVCSVLLPTKHLTEVTRDRVVLVYMLIKGMPINVEAILKQNMMNFRNNLRWRFCYGGLITHFLRTQGIEEESCDLTIAFHPNLTGKLVDVTRTKALDTTHRHVLSAQERQVCNDSVMERMFGMAELQPRIGGRSVTNEEMETMAECYPLTESAIFLCRTGPAFLEPLDDDEATDDEAMDDEEDDVVDEEANALMVFDRNDDEA